MDNCHLTEDLLEVIMSLTSNPWVWFTVNKYFWKSKSLLINILSENVRPIEKHKFRNLGLECGVEDESANDYRVIIYTFNEDELIWLKSWSHGYTTYCGRLYPIMVPPQSEKYFNPQSLWKGENMDVSSMFYILIMRIYTINKITGIFLQEDDTINYQKARKYTLLYMKRKLENLDNLAKKYIYLMMCAKIMGLTTEFIELKIDYNADIDLKECLNRLDQQVIKDLPILEENVIKGILKLDYIIL